MNMLKTYCDLTTDQNSTKFLGIDLQRDYDKQTACLLMNDYISTVLQYFQHVVKSKPTHSPYPHTLPTYSAKTQLALAPNNSSPLNVEMKQQMQAIIGSLLYYAYAVENKLLVILGSRATQIHTLIKRAA